MPRASLPWRRFRHKPVLQARLAGAIISPVSTTASLLAAPLRNFAYALQQLADQKAAAA